MAEEKVPECLQEPDLATYFSADSDRTFKALRTYAACAEDAERHEDEMLFFVKELVKLRLEKLGKAADADAKKEVAGSSEGPLGLEVRNVFSVAFKTTVGERRTAWRQLDTGSKSTADEIKHLEKDDSPANQKAIAYAKTNQKYREMYKEIIYQEIVQHCTELTKYAGDLAAEAKKMDLEAPNDAWVFYTKMKADYLRYQCEVTPNRNEELLKACEQNYKDAYDEAKKQFKATNSTRLGLALNFSVCKYEILDDREGAKELAKEAFDEAIKHLSDASVTDNKDSTLIMQLLRDNLTLWSPSGADADDDQD